MGSGIGVHGTAEGMWGYQWWARGEPAMKALETGGWSPCQVCCGLGRSSSCRRLPVWRGLDCSVRICSCGRGVCLTMLGFHHGKRLGRKLSWGASSPNHQLWIPWFACRGGDRRLINEPSGAGLGGVWNPVTHSRQTQTLAVNGAEKPPSLSRTGCVTTGFGQGIKSWSF